MLDELLKVLSLLLHNVGQIPLDSQSLAGGPEVASELPVEV
jgi:hypothetical protein